MHTRTLAIKDFDSFQIVFETDDYALVFKPPNIPTAPLHENEPDTLLARFFEERPQAKNVCGAKKSIEAGLIHRLDTPTSGLVIIAKKQAAYNALLKLQENELITKTYFAFCCSSADVQISLPLTIKTKFRPFGVGGKKVKPVPLDAPCRKKTSDTIYTTQLISCSTQRNYLAMQVQITKGYRHQIRSHLSSCGFPIVGDSLYNEKHCSGRLQLYAIALQFPQNIYNESSPQIRLAINTPKNILH